MSDSSHRNLFFGYSRDRPIVGRRAPRPRSASQNSSIGDSVDRDQARYNPPTIPHPNPRQLAPRVAMRDTLTANERNDMLRRLADMDSALERVDVVMEQTRRVIERVELQLQEARHSGDVLTTPRFPLKTDEHQALAAARVAAGQGSVAAVLPRAERERVIRELRKENENPAPPMSRACRICFVDSPLRRAVFTACGHASCNACALRLEGAASDEGKILACTFCRAETGFVPLFEDAIGASEN